MAKTSRPRIAERAPSASVLENVASRLKELRRERRLSLQELAEVSGVSRSLLSEIERGETNPTLATLWNLTQALNVDIAALVEAPNGQGQRSSVEVHAAAQVPKIETRGSKSVLKILSPPHMAGRFEWYLLELAAGGHLTSPPHHAGTQEHLTVLSGRIRVLSLDTKAVLKAGDVARYRADVPHKIEAEGGAAQALLVVITP
jgi:XRE family transcriptional regulator, regulator of sulfur utilization